jgi:dTDP-4-amino-4,6-dideoxygalactose transaminase
MKVPFFDYTQLYNSQSERFMGTIKSVLERGDFILRDDLIQFETALAKYCNVKHAIGVANGTDAIWIALMAVGVERGDEVILPSHTYVATAGAAVLLGAKPVLVECGSDHLIDQDDIERAITEKTKVIIPVQINGRTANMDPIIEIANKHNITIVEDSAQGLGSKFNGQMAGSFGAAGTYSFFPAKVLGCFGDGGGVITNDDSVAEKVRLIRDHGRNESGEVVEWGINSRLDNIQAAILLEKLSTFDDDIRRRREIADIYQNQLGKLKELKLPPPPNEGGQHFDTYQNYEIECENRDELKIFLADNGVGTIIQWAGKAIHQLVGLGFKDVHLPKTELLFQKCLLLPMNTFLTDDEVGYIGLKIKEFY